MKADVRVELEDGRYLFHFTPEQCRLFKEALQFGESIEGGDVASLVLAGSTRAGLIELGRKFSAREVRLSVEEVHVLFSSLAATVIAFQSERAFNVRTGSYREQAVMLANALVREVVSAGESVE